VSLVALCSLYLPNIISLKSI